jgi:hypothetical protein
MNDIDIMILISIQPFAPKKMFALGATLLCLSTASCFADALFLSIDSKGQTRQHSRTLSISSPADELPITRAENAQPAQFDQRIQAPGATDLRLAAKASTASSAAAMLG